MTGDMILALAAFGGASSLVALLFLLAAPRDRQIEERLAEASLPATEGNSLWNSMVDILSRVGSNMMPNQQAKLERIQTRFLQAGFYRKHTSSAFFAVRFLLLVFPIFVGLGLSAFELLSVTDGLVYGGLVGVLGTVIPGLFISQLRQKRQRQIRRALPDALDVLVICVEGGLSLSASFSKVTEEMETAYPLLARELGIVRRQIELGKSTADAFRDFSDRFEVEELRSLAMLISQSERYGASLARTLRIQADALRLKRYQWAEAQAQKAPLKIIFPTVLCFFPALYIALMGPAVMQLYEALKSLK